MKFDCGGWWVVMMMWMCDGEGIFLFTLDILTLQIIFISNGAQATKPNGDTHKASTQH